MNLKNCIAIPAILSGLFLFATIAKAQTTAPAMPKAPATINIDGIVAEWKDSAPVSDAKLKLSYTIANNDTALFVSAYATDGRVKKKISMAGITIAINTQGKKRKTYAITYPAQGSFLNLVNSSDSSLNMFIKTSGFKAEDDTVSATSNIYGIQAAYKFDSSSNIGYEMAIPLKILKLKTDKSNELFINISVNSLDEDSGGGYARSNGGGGASGGDSPRRGGKLPPAPNMLPNMNSSSPGSSEGQNTWIKLVLAK